MRRFVQAFSGDEAWPVGWGAGVRDELAEDGGHYNIAPNDDAWIVLDQGALQAKRFRWGLVPPWAKDPSTRYTTVTARLDRANRSRIFGKPWKSQHCIVPMNGYYKLDRTTKPHVPHFIHGEDGGVLLAAGLWERWDKDGELCTFTILTHANPAIPLPLTPDGPVFVTPTSARIWLEGPQLLAGAWLRLCGSPKLASYEVSRRYRDRALDDYTLIEPASAGDYLAPLSETSDEDE